MLSISNVANSTAAGSYYEQADDYYSRDRSPSIWSGKGAADLGLSGVVQSETFRQLLDGLLHGGQQIHNAGAGHRGGTDLTFSAPKSVSMQALIGGDTRLLAAHEAAVSRALDCAEKLAACRVTNGGVTVREKTGTMVVAQFRHDLSRAIDPQLHTHCVVLNATKRPDGVWRALDNEPLYRHKMFLGAYYRSELAREVQALGYEVRVTHGDGRFELAHIEPAQIKVFSSRSRQIEDELRALGKTREQLSAVQLQVIALQTRQRKVALDREVMQIDWAERAAAAAIDFTIPHQAPSGVPEPKSALLNASRAVSHAASHLSERDAVMQRTDLLRAALEYGVGLTDLQGIELALEQAVACGEVIRVGELCTTPAAQQRERDILNMEVAGRGQVESIMEPEAMQQALQGHMLNAGQAEVVKHILCAADRIVGVQGSAGTGKTTALKAVHELAASCGVNLIGIAPSAGAARELTQTGMPSQTLAAFAARGFNGLTSSTLVVLDEAGMVSARDMHTLLSAVSQNKARAVLVGDVQQLKAVEAGRPFDQLQAAGMSTAMLNEILRQRETTLKDAVRLAAVGETGASLHRLQSIERSLVEIEPHGQRHTRMAADYAALTPEKRERTLMVSGTNHHREVINMQVRQMLSLEGQGQVLMTLSRKDLSQTQALRTVSYEDGDVLRAERDYKSLGMRRGELARVVDGPAGVVTLQRADGQCVQWRPARHPYFTAFMEHQREIALGDVMRVTRNNYQLGVVNGERVKVVALPDIAMQPPSPIVLEKLDGKRLLMDATEPLYLEYGYCQTVHAAQGQTCERILIEAPTTGGIGNESSYYVAISRATHAAILYTDDAQRLPEVLSRTDQKAAALDLERIEPAHKSVGFEIE